MLKVSQQSLRIGQLKETTLEDERLLESYLRDFISDNHQLVLEEIDESGLALLPPERNAHDSARDRIDLLGIDTDGAAVIIELKRGKHKLHMLQAVSYAAMIAHRPPEWFKRQLKPEQLDDLKKTILGDLDKALNRKQRIVLIAEQFEPQVIMAARWLRSFGISVKCLELSMATDDAEPKSLYMQFNQVFPSSYVDHLLPQGADVLPKEFEQLLSDIRDFTTVRPRQGPAGPVPRPPKEGAGALEIASPKDWEGFVGSLKNPDLVEFVRKWEESGERILPDSDYRLVYPRTRERWRVQAREAHAWVMQSGRFDLGGESDEAFWKRLLDPGANVRILRDGKRLHFDLSTKRDFDAFWLAITQTLKDVPFTVT